jgi:hypothetical protein
MYIQLVDKHGFKSPILYIHSDEEEFVEQINIWRNRIREIIINHPHANGLPLGRLEPNTCMVDLIMHLGNYYVENTPLSFVPKGHVYGCLSLMNEEDVLEYGDEITQINLHE